MFLFSDNKGAIKKDFVFFLEKFKKYDEKTITHVGNIPYRLY